MLRQYLRYIFFFSNCSFILFFLQSETRSSRFINLDRDWNYRLEKTINAENVWFTMNLRTIAVGGGPSGPSIEGPFCCAVHLWRALRDRKIQQAKKGKKIKKKEGIIKKRRKRNEKKRKIAEILFIFYALLSFQGHSILFSQLFLSYSQALSYTGGPLKA